MRGRKLSKPDLSSLSFEDALLVMQEATTLIKTRQRNSVLFMTDVKNVAYSKETVSGIKEFSISNSPFIKATAVVGMDTFKQAILNTVRFLSLHEIKSFDSEQDAKDWLTQVK